MRRHALDPALPAGRSLGRVSAEADAPRTSAGAARFWRDPALPFAESRIAQNSRACYQAHAHDTLSVGMVERGASRFSSQDRVHDLAPASVVMVPAGVVHACNPLPDAAWSYRMLHLDADWCDALWRESGQRVASSTVVTRRGAASALRALTDLLHGAGGVAAKETALIEYVGGLRWIVPAAHATGTASDDTIASHPGITRVIALLRDDCTCNHAVADLAAQAGLSRYHFIRAFRARTGITPHAFQTDLRIQQARRLLQAGQAPAEVAHALGFADQSHFQRVFKARVAATPGQYRALAAH
ncbi:helix-turn-helix transcriptional regulator [Bordetella genomosp. 5]|uniref:helix-turn-helix transcriptional regulator n=1 Tax=Bordetella genomosp. 5 TaxID=1395608 RepID=UPI00201687A7|nr:AraC family transcriptional regulator [Bordetella genomosp. 5]